MGRSRPSPSPCKNMAEVLSLSDFQVKGYKFRPQGWFRHLRPTASSQESQRNFLRGERNSQISSWVKDHRTTEVGKMLETTGSVTKTSALPPFQGWFFKRSLHLTGNFTNPVSVILATLK